MRSGIREEAILSRISLSVWHPPAEKHIPHSLACH